MNITVQIEALERAITKLRIETVKCLKSKDSTVLDYTLKMNDMAALDSILTDLKQLKNKQHAS